MRGMPAGATSDVLQKTKSTIAVSMDSPRDRVGVEAGRHEASGEDKLWQAWSFLAAAALRLRAVVW